jgi:iron(III) transport system substrate-binding protein
LYLRLARGEGDVTLWNLPDIYLQTDVIGYPFDYVYPSSGTPVLTDGIAIVKGAPAPDHAKAFYEFVTSDSALVRQARDYYRIPVRQDIPDELLPEWMTGQELTRMDVDFKKLAEKGPEWMLLWDERIKGRGEDYLNE